MVPVIPILVNIENLNEATARSITDTFISALGKVKHTDATAFFRDLQPICREVKCRAKLIDDISVEIIEKESTDEVDKYIFNMVSSGREEKSFNCIITMNKDNDLYVLNSLYLFVPGEIVSDMRTCSIDIEVKKGGEDNNDDERAATPKPSDQ